MTPGNSCPHPAFEVAANVDRTVDQNQKLLSLRLQVRVRCSQCGAPMWFPGHATGSSHRIAATSTDGRELTVPIVPVGQRFEPHPDLASVTTRNTDLLKGQP